MSKVVAAFTAIIGVLKTYPALSAAAVNIGVIILSYFGLHVSGEQLLWIVGVVSALLGLVVHSNVTPVSKLKSAVQLAVDSGAYPASVAPRPVSEETQMMPAYPLAPPPTEVVYEAIVPLEGGKYK